MGLPQQGLQRIEERGFKDGSKKKSNEMIYRITSHILMFSSTKMRSEQKKADYLHKYIEKIIIKYYVIFYTYVRLFKMI